MTAQRIARLPRYGWLDRFRFFRPVDTATHDDVVEQLEVDRFRLDALGEQQLDGAFLFRQTIVTVAEQQIVAVFLRGVFGAALRLLPGYTEDWIRTPFYDTAPVSQTVSAVLFVALCVYVWVASTRKVEQP